MYEPNTIANSFIGMIGSKSLIENHESYMLSSMFGSDKVYENIAHKPFIFVGLQLTRVIVQVPDPVTKSFS